MEIVPPSVELQHAFADGSSDEQDFVQQLGIFLSSFLKSHSHALEQMHDVQLLGIALEYMVNVSRVEDVELFKVRVSISTDCPHNSGVHVHAPLMMTHARRLALGMCRCVWSTGTHSQRVSLTSPLVRAEEA